MTERQQEKPSLALSPVSGSAVSPAGDDRPPHHEDDDDDFEFAIVAREPDETSRVLPVYPVFGRALLLSPPSSSDKNNEDDEAEGPDPQIPVRRLLIEGVSCRSGSISSSSSEAEDLGSAAARKYSPWTPRSAPQSPDRYRKSASTGTERRWRLLDLLGGRSHSDGKEKSRFFEASSSPPPSGRNPSPRPSGPRATEVDMFTARRTCSGKKGGSGQAATGPRRQSFLPYRQELFGLFAARTRHPF